MSLELLLMVISGKLSSGKGGAILVHVIDLVELLLAVCALVLLVLLCFVLIILLVIFELKLLLLFQAVRILCFH